MEAEATVVADAAESSALVACHDALRGVLDDQEMMPGGDIHDRVHLAGDAGVVDRNDGPCLVGDGVLNLCLINIHGIRTDIHEDNGGAAQHKGVRG